MSNPRIISGVARGIRLKVAPGDITRPITDRVKEALFNIIGSDIFDSSFLDLFGGTGSVGIEALSRGAKFSRFIDLNRAAIDAIRNNLEATKLLSKANLIQSDAFSFISRKADLTFDYVFIAPPQYKDMWKKGLQLIDQHIDWLNPEAWIIAQIAPNEYQKLDLTNLDEFDSRKYGSTLLVFYGKFRN
jgi:16S rRNA (guanine(966)-N(2))-methyltransferase RsmD